MVSKPVFHFQIFTLLHFHPDHTAILLLIRTTHLQEKYFFQQNLEEGILPFKD